MRPTVGPIPPGTRCRRSIHSDSYYLLWRHRNPHSLIHKNRYEKIWITFYTRFDTLYDDFVGTRVVIFNFYLDFRHDGTTRPSSDRYVSLRPPVDRRPFRSFSDWSDEGTTTGDTAPPPSSTIDVIVVNLLPQSQRKDGHWNFNSSPYKRLPGNEGLVTTYDLKRVNEQTLYDYRIGFLKTIGNLGS